jgi:hypothetical protein
MTTNTRFTLSTIFSVLLAATAALLHFREFSVFLTAPLVVVAAAALLPAFKALAEDSRHNYRTTRY